MEAGTLDQRIELYRRDLTTPSTGSGAPQEEWVLEGTVWAQVQPVGGSEAFAAAVARTASTLVRFRMRWRPDLEPTWRLKWRGSWYDIAEILPGGQRLREWLDVAASASPAENAG